MLGQPSGILNRTEGVDSVHQGDPNAGDGAHPRRSIPVDMTSWTHHRRPRIRDYPTMDFIPIPAPRYFHYGVIFKISRNVGRFDAKKNTG